MRWVALDSEGSPELPGSAGWSGEPALRRLRRSLDTRSGSPRPAAHSEEASLTGLIPATTKVLSRVFAIEGRGRDLFDAAERLDLEGIVAKRKVDSYRPETVWYKIKSRTYTQGEGRWGLFEKKRP